MYAIQICAELWYGLEYSSYVCVAALALAERQHANIVEAHCCIIRE